jgi:receptor expression-enhancing protein 5/6
LAELGDVTEPWVGGKWRCCVFDRFDSPVSFAFNLSPFLAYASFKAIESASKNDDTQWLTYWTVFAAFNIIEFFADIILYWIPFYYLLKTLTLIWLYLPSFRGAEYVYRSVLAPYLLSHQAKIDSTIKEIKTKAEAVTESLQSNTADSQ